MRSRHYLLAALVLAAAAMIPTPAAASTSVTTIASGLDSPRGVAFFHGKLYVAEAGHGGPVCDAPPPDTTICIGLTSQISRINANGSHTPLVSGLYSAVEFHGGPPEALGSEALSVSHDRLLNILGVYPQAFDNFHCASGDAACAAILAAARAQAGWLISVGANGSVRRVASVGANQFNFTANIPNQEHDANPYGVLAADGGAYVTDAGANTLLFVTSRGKIRLLQYFPFRDETGFPTDEVPTCIARTHGALWVGTLTGHLYRVRGSRATRMAAPLLHHVTGCTADEDGNLYLVNMWSPMFPTPFTGNVIKFKTGSGASSVVMDGLDLPNMITIGPDHNLYVSADSICPTGGIPGICPNGGTVLRISINSEDDED